METHTTDALESLVERQAETIERQEQVIQELRETVERLEGQSNGGAAGDLPVSRRGALKAGGVLAALGLGVGTASADPTGQIGTADRPVETVYAAGLNGPLTGGAQLTSLTGSGLAVEGGTLTADVDLDVADLDITTFDVEDRREGLSSTVDVTLAELAGEDAVDVTLSLVVEQDGDTVDETTIEGVSLDADEERTFTFGEDGGSEPVDALDAGEHTATVTATAANAADRSAESTFEVTGVTVIETWTDLDAVRDDLAETYVLDADLDEETTGYGGDGENGVVLDADGSLRDGVGFEPIGDSDNNFTGTFDGNGHTITGLKIDRDSNEGTGLFVSNAGTIQDVTLEDVDVVLDNEDVGGLAGGNSGRIINSSVSGSVEGIETVGGLVGFMEDGGSIEESAAACDVSGNAGVGGLVGSSGREREFEIRNSYATGTVSATGAEPQAIGGIAGSTRSETSIERCYATGTVEGDDALAVGGLVGNNNDGTIEESYATGDVSGDERVGGLVGYVNTNSDVSESYATGDVSGNSDVGGLAGDRGVGDLVEQSYWDVPATGQDDSAGGGTGIGSLSDDPPADGMVGDDLDADLESDFNFTDTWETVSADDEDTDADDYPVLQALDRATQLEVRE